MRIKGALENTARCQVRLKEQYQREASHPASLGHVVFAGLSERCPRRAMRRATPRHALGERPAPTCLQLPRWKVAAWVLCCNPSVLVCRKRAFGAATRPHSRPPLSLHGYP